MSDLHLSNGNDNFDQRSVGDPALPWDWLTVWGEAGNDHLLMYGGTALGGAGNDWIGSDPTVQGANVSVAYWNSPAGVLVDLEAGYAIDGFGNTDTLSAISGAHGSGRNDTLLGSGGDNSFWPNGGFDRIDGRGGHDRVGLNGSPADYLIEVAGDGTHATVTKTNDRNLRYELTDVEVLNFWQANSGVDLVIADLVRPEARAVHLLTQDPAARWNANQPTGTPVELTFSFRTAPGGGDGMPGTGFQAFDATQRQLTRELLGAISVHTGITFIEVSDQPASHGQLRFGITQQTETAGISFAPNDPGSGERAGDVWMDVETMTGLAVGSIGFGVLLHEVGHALGLSHPGEDGTLRGPLQGDDSTALTVMSANGLLDGIPRATLGAYDLLALQALYGVREVHAGDDLYLLDDDAGRCQWILDDDGGNDTIDASSLSYGVDLQLGPGSIGVLRCSSVGMREDGAAALDNLVLMPGSMIESAVGTPFDDLIVGNDLDNVFTLLTGNDELDAAGGFDTALLPGALGDHRFNTSFGVLHISSLDGASGAKALTAVERLVFTDFSVNLRMSETLAGIAPADVHLVEELYVAFFNRVPNASGLAHWIGKLVSGDTVETVAEAFYEAGIQYADLTGYRAGMSDADFINAVYRNVLARPEGASEKGLAYWSSELTSGNASRGSLVVQILTSAHSFKGDATWGWVADLLDNKILVADLFAVEWGLSFTTPQASIARGMAIAAAVTSHDTSAAIALIGVSETDMGELTGAG